MCLNLIMSYIMLKEKAGKFVCRQYTVLFYFVQLQVEPVSKSAQSKYSGVLQCTRCVLREEGWRALWKGHIPAQVLSIFYGVGQVSGKLLCQSTHNTMCVALSKHFLFSLILSTITNIKSVSVQISCLDTNDILST